MEDLLPAAAWLTCSWLILRWSLDTARRLFPADRPSELVLHVGVICTAVIISGLTVSGALGVLSPLLGLLVPLSFAFGMKQFVRRRFPEIAPEDLISVSLSPWGCLWSFVVACLAGHSIVNGVMQFPTDWDTLMYHLPFINHWIQTGSFAATETPRWSDPANSEVLGLWFAIAFSGDFLVALNNVPNLIVWIAAMITVARGLGLSGAWANLVAMASISVSVTFRQAVDASNDLMVPAFFFAAVAYALRFYKTARSENLTLFGTALGLVVGVKFFATGYGLVAGITFTSMCWNRWGAVQALLYSARAICISLLFGGYWFVRNFWMKGHVFYPKGTDDLHRRIPHPDLAQTTLAWNGDALVPELTVNAVWEHCGPIHMLFLAVLPTLTVFMIWTVWSNHSNFRRMNGLLLLLLGGTFSLALNTPLMVEDQPDTLNHLRWGYTPARYSLTFLSMVVLTVISVIAKTLEGASARVSKMCQIVISILIGYQLWMQISQLRSPVKPDLLVTFLTAELLLIVAFTLLAAFRRNIIYGRILLVVSMGLSTFLICKQSSRWHDGFSPRYNEFYSTSYFTDSEMEEDRILYLDYRPYAFFGSRRQNYLVQPLDFRSVEEVVQTMEESKLSTAITLIETQKKLSRFRPVWELLNEHPDFELSATGRALRIFKLRKPSEAL